MSIIRMSEDSGIVFNKKSPENEDIKSGNNRGKHSSGDLHSRLKTRKLLGVGETDDGDVHRSKLSQILGHSDQLYIRLPGGLRVWQICLATLFSIMSVWALLFPSHYFMSMYEADGTNFTLAIRLYATALVSMSVVYWCTVKASDRDTIRLVLLSSVVFFMLQTLVTGLSYISGNLPVSRRSLCLWAIWSAFALIGFHFYYFGMAQRFGGGMKRTMSNKELTDKDQ